MINVKYNRKYYKLESASVVSPLDFDINTIFRFYNTFYNIRNFKNKDNSLIIMNLFYEKEYGFIIRKTRK